jgi:hypothetical protein
MSMGRGGYIPPSGPLRFVSLFANIFCVRDFLSFFFPVIIVILFGLLVR